MSGFWSRMLFGEPYKYDLLFEMYAERDREGWDRCRESLRLLIEEQDNCE